MPKLGVLHDPLVDTICTPDEVWAMVNEMVVAHAEWLPQYADAVPTATKSFTKSTVKTRDLEGADRKRMRSMEELRELTGNWIFRLLLEALQGGRAFL